MPRLAYLPLTVIGLAALVAGLRILQPSHLYVESDNRDVLETVAAVGIAQLTASAPTKTPIPTSTPTSYPRKPTETPLPTWQPNASPGVYIVPMWTEVPPVARTAEIGLPPCSTVTPHPYVDTACEVNP